MDWYSAFSVPWPMYSLVATLNWCVVRAEVGWAFLRRRSYGHFRHSETKLGVNHCWRQRDGRSGRRRFGEQLADHGLRTVVISLAEVDVPDPAGLVDEIEGRPVAVPIGVPGGVCRIEGHREPDVGLGHRIADVVEVAL